MASAAPADPYEPVGTEAVVGDTVEIRGQLFEVKKASGTAFVTDERGGAIYGCDQRAPTYRILKRQAPPATGFQVWRQEDGNLSIARDDAKGSLVLATRVGWRWHKERTDGPDEYVCATLLAGPEADKAIAEAREQGAIS